MMISNGLAHAAAFLNQSIRYMIALTAIGSGDRPNRLFRFISGLRPHLQTIDFI
jgi:hypothetical protein